LKRRFKVSVQDTAVTDFPHLSPLAESFFVFAWGCCKISSSLEEMVMRGDGYARPTYVP
jgi:hypothetical protein